MKIITVNSKKHGIKEIFVDDEDFDFLNQFNWSITYRKKNMYYAERCDYTTKPKKTIRMHRLIMNCLEDPKIIVDHVFHNGLDNQKCNLRKSSTQQNSRNMRVRVTPKTSKYMGVYFEKSSGKYIAQISKEQNGKFTHKKVGRFSTELEAAVARDDAAKKHYGEFANLNFKN